MWKEAVAVRLQYCLHLPVELGNALKSSGQLESRPEYKGYLNCYTTKKGGTC